MLNIIKTGFASTWSFRAADPDFSDFLLIRNGIQTQKKVGSGSGQKDPDPKH